MTNWYCKLADRVVGPFSSETLQKMRDLGEIGPAALVREEHATQWISVSALEQRPLAAPPIPYHKDADALSPAPPLPQGHEPLWWLNDEGESGIAGPFSRSKVLQLLRARKVASDALVCEVGSTAWQPLHDAPRLLSNIKTTWIHRSFYVGIACAALLGAVERGQVKLSPSTRQGLQLVIVSAFLYGIGSLVWRAFRLFRGPDE